MRGKPYRGLRNRHEGSYQIYNTHLLVQGSRFNRKEGEKKKEGEKRAQKKEPSIRKKKKEGAFKRKKKRAKEGANKNTGKIAQKHGFEAKIVGKKKGGRKEGSQKNRPPS